MLTQDDKMYLQRLLGDGRFGDLLEDIKSDLAKDILNTGIQDTKIREDLYTLSRAIDALNTKLQECANYEILEGDFK